MKDQKRKSAKKRKNKASNALWMALMGVSFGVLLWLKSDHISHSVGGISRMHEDMVDYFLKDVEAEKRYRQAKVEVDNFYYAPEIDDFSALRPGTSEQEDELSYGVVMDQGAEAERIFQEIDGGSQMANRQLPDEIINRRLLDQQEYEVYQQETEKAYVETFKANALRAGYKVEVDKNLQVKGVRKVRHPGNYLPD